MKYRPPDPQILEIDDIDVRAVTPRQHPSVRQANEASRIGALLLHDIRHIEARRRTIASPVFQQRGRGARVTDRADVGTSVREARKREPVGQHLADDVEISVAIVVARDVEHGVAIVLEERVVGDLFRRPALRRSAGGNGLTRTRLVVRRVSHLVHPVPQVQPPAAGPELDIRGEIRHEPTAESRIAHDLRLLRCGQVGDLAEHRIRAERVQGAAEPVQDADATRRHLADDSEAPLVGVLCPGQDGPEQACPLVIMTIGKRERQRHSGGLRHGAQHRELAIEIIEIGGELEHAGTIAIEAGNPAERRCDADEFLRLGPERWRRISLAGPVDLELGAAEPERALLDAGTGEPAHRRDVLVGGGLTRGTSIAHHEQAQRIVRHVDPEVDVMGDSVQGVEILAEAVPAPFQALVQSRAGDVLHPLHQLDEGVMVRIANGSEPHAAVSHHRAGYSQP